MGDDGDGFIYTDELESGLMFVFKEDGGTAHIKRNTAY